MKRFFILFMLVLLPAFVLSGCGSDQDAGTIAELQATISDLQNQVGEYSALKTELDSANNSIAELQSQMDALTAEKEEMSTKLEILYKIEAVDETMFTIANVDIYDDLYGEALGNEPTGNIPAGQEIKITGKSIVNDWYEIEMEGKKQYVSGSLLGDTVPTTQKPSTSGNTGSTGGSTQQPSGGGNGQGSQPSTGGGITQDQIDSIFGPGSTGGATEGGPGAGKLP